MSDIEDARAEHEALTPLPDEARMDAYYYGFKRTGVGAVDAILSAVAVAGKGLHSTYDWADDDHADYWSHERPGLPSGQTSAEGLIQATAEQSAAAIKALAASRAVPSDPYPDAEGLAALRENAVPSDHTATTEDALRDLDEGTVIVDATGEVLHYIDSGEALIWSDVWTNECHVSLPARVLFVPGDEVPR